MGKVMFLVAAHGLFPDTLLEFDPKRNPAEVAEMFPANIYFYA